MFITKIKLIPTGTEFNIYSGLTSSTTVNLIATNVTDSFEHTFDINDLVLGFDVLQYYFLKLTSEGGDILIKVKAHDVEYCDQENPFDFIFGLTLKSINELLEDPSLEPTLVNPIDWFTYIFLLDGLVQQQSCLICPPCNGLYYIGNTDTYLSIYEFTEAQSHDIFFNILTGCCVNYAMSLTKYSDYVSALGSLAVPFDEEIDGVYYKYSSCNNGFKEKVLLLETLDPTKFNILIDNGIFEVGTVSDSTGLSDLITFYTGNSINSYDGSNTINDTILDWLNNGISFFCYNNDYRIGNHDILIAAFDDLSTALPTTPGP